MRTDWNDPAWEDALERLEAFRETLDDELVSGERRLSVGDLDLLAERLRRTAGAVFIRSVDIADLAQEADRVRAAG